MTGKGSAAPPTLRPSPSLPEKIPDSSQLRGARGNPRQLHVVDRTLLGVFCNPEAGSRALLWELLASAGKFPPRAEVSGAASVTESLQTTDSPGWTTFKVIQTWKLMLRIPRIAIDVAGMGIT